MRTIRTLGIVGSGTMGRGIALAALAEPGVDVLLLDSRPDALEAARAQLSTQHGRLQDKAMISREERARRDAAASFTASFADLGGCDLVIEAVPEVSEIKHDVLHRLAAELKPGAVIASNTSSMSITRLAGAVTDPAAFLGIHFFNPVSRMDLVEVVRTPHSDPAVEDDVVQFLDGHLKKTVIVVEDRPGFVVNALLVPFLLSAARMLDQGYATAEQIDAGLKLGAGHPMGPLALSDLIGLDVLRDIGDAIHAETRDPSVVVPNNVRRLVDAGFLGRKTGAGFYTYPQ